MSARPTLKKPSLFPWFTFVWACFGVVGLLAIPHLVRSQAAHPVQALAAPVVVVDIESQVQALSRRVAHLESEVASLRAQPAATLSAELNALRRRYSQQAAVVASHGSDSTSVEELGAGR
ncbi:hypothetical protein [Paludisphaera rhizosphaerae]|uniref:hypothetical protein n=1 Tax=Paludisphaera rhizosphaerae TaxID=2711216 RepID=UPI0013EC1CCC|nr:hypothetical protein [Paludisphaera rhizosphaerae]